MKLEEIKTGVIGVGSMGQNHARIYNDISNLIGVADPNRAQGSNIASKLGVEYFEDYRELLKLVEAVSISTPTSTHREIAEKAFAVGVNALVEKPLAGSIEDSKAIVNAAKNANRVLAVGHIERFNESIRFSKEKLQSGEWGDILTISARRFSNFPSRIQDVGVIFDLSIHDVDILSYLLDEKPDFILANGGKARNETHEDHVVISLKYPSNIIGVCETSWLTPMKVREIGITTDSHYIKIDLIKQEIDVCKSLIQNFDKSKAFDKKMKFTEDKIILKKSEPLVNEISDFLLSILGKKEPLVSGSSGLTAVKTVDAALRSMELNKLIKI